MRQPRKQVLRALAWAGVAFLALRAGGTILRDPCVGVADILDYWRVARPAGIEVEPQRHQSYFMVCTFAVAEANLAQGLTTPTLLAWLARASPWPGGAPPGRFHIRQVGFVYWSLSVAALVGAGLMGVSALYLLLCAWVLFDSGFLLFFNSLYADPALLVGLVAATLLLLARPRGASGKKPAREPGSLVLVFLFCATALAGFSKMQYSVFPAVLLGTYGLSLILRRLGPARREWLFLAGLSAMAVTAPLLFLLGPAPRFLDANNYNALFGGIARAASNPAAALGALGIPEEFQYRKSKDYFAAKSGPKDPAMASVRRLSRLRLAALYLSDPPALAYAARRTHKDLSRIRTHPRGTLTRLEGGRKRAYFSRPEQFSRWRNSVLLRLPYWSLWLLVLAAAFLGLRALRRQWSNTDTACLLLVTWAVSQIGVAILGEGFVNLHQHLLGARLAVDLLLVVCLGRQLLWAGRRLGLAVDPPRLVEEAG